MTNFEPRNYRIDNVELNWAKLSAPVEPFPGTRQWELQIATTDKAIADTWAANHLTVKPVLNKDKTPVTPAKYAVNLKRKAVKADGNNNAPVKVVDISAQPITNGQLSKVGNGSIGNVIVYQYPYEYMGNTGITSSLTAVQITSLKEYAEAPMFEAISVDMEASKSDTNNTEMPF